MKNSLIKNLAFGIYTLFILSFFLSSCGYRAIDFTEKKRMGKLNKVYCIKSVDIYRPEEQFTDILYKKVSQAIISSGYKISCNPKKANRYIFIKVNSVNITPIGYSPSLRASVYNLSISLNFRVENKKREILINKNISEITEYAGSGLSAELGKRYAVENLGKFIETRIFSILSQEEEFYTTQSSKYDN